MGERSYLSIGDVLSLLREEFPDITISKIRFLESRGLLIPERTPSGYRKFYEHDVDRLRWILRQQRENFLPLKVIKGRLEGQEPSSEQTPMFEVASGTGAPPPHEPQHASHYGNGSPGRLEPTPVEAGVMELHSTMAAPVPTVTAATGQVTPPPATEPMSEGRTAVAMMAAARGTGSAVVASADEPRPASGSKPTSGRRSASSAEVRAGGASGRSGAEHSRVAASAGTAGTEPSLDRPPPGADLGGGAGPDDGSGPEGGPGPDDGFGSDGGPRQDDAPARASSAGASSRRAEVKPGSVAPQGASLTAAELAHASGLDVAQVEELESYGLIESRMVADVPCYDEDALLVSGLAAAFARFGVEARHLRIFKHAAERQASLYSQIVMPLLRQRNPDARRRAHDDLTRLTELGASLQACFAQAVLQDLTRG